MGRLEGKVAVITGGASGIGEGTARKFVAEGARCVIADLQLERAQVIAAELGDACVAISADVAIEDQVSAVVDLAVETFGQLISCLIMRVFLAASAPLRRLALRDGIGRWTSFCRVSFLVSSTRPE